MITIDKDGKIIDYYAERNTEIQAKLQPTLDTLVEQKKKDIKGIQKFGYRFAVNLDACLRSYGLMSAEEFAHLQYDDIECGWHGFLDLIATYNLAFELIPNKQLLCSYLRLNIRQYAQLEKSQDEDIKSLMISLNDFFVGNAFTATESGNAPAQAVKQRLEAHNVGHDVVPASTDKIIDKLSGQSTPQELERRLEQITGNKIRLIGEKKS